jgi:hypothetical protein
MDKGDIISSSIAGLSLIVAGLSAWRQTRLQARVTSIEQGRRDEEIEARRHARVTARVSLRFWPEAELVLTNHGPAEARSVGFTISAANDGSVPVLDDEDAELLPLNVLHPDVPMSFPLATKPEDCTLLLVTVTWTDPAGSHEKQFKLRRL